jgi:hypothetical protein
MSEKFSTFLWVEVCVYRMKNLGPNKGLENLESLRQKLVAISRSLRWLRSQSLSEQVDFPLFQDSCPTRHVQQNRVADIKIHDTRMMRLMEVQLRSGPQLNG